MSAVCKRPVLRHLKTLDISSAWQIHRKTQYILSAADLQAQKLRGKPQTAVQT